MHIIVVALHRPEEPTGVCRHAANLARCLAETDKVTQITLVTGIWQKHYFETVLLHSLKKINVLGIHIKNTSLSRNLWFLFGLPDLVEKLQPDLVHLSFPLPFFRSKFTCPVVCTIHDLYPYKFPENFGYKQVFFNRLFLKQCIQNSDALACVSNTTLDDLRFYFPEVDSIKKKVKVIYNFVDFDRVEPKLPAALPDRIDYPFILCVGQHRKNKNLDLLIKAYALLLNENKINSNIKLVCVGGLGPETENLLQLIKQLSLVDSIVMLSSIDDNQLCWLYQNCELFVIPSSLEGFCIPLVEALYFSCKVVCSDIPVFREIGTSDCTYFNLQENPIWNIAQSITLSLQADISIGNDSCSRFTKTEIATQYLKFYLESILSLKGDSLNYNDIT
jgi:glycosyltransferase involved in cell wall biosynthesis